VALGFLFVRRRDVPERFLGLAQTPLRASQLAVTDLGLAIVFAFGGAALFHIAAAHAGQRWFPAPVDGSMGIYHVVAGAAFQLGLLAGLGHAWFWHLRPSRRNRLAGQEPVAEKPASPALSRVLRGGFFTFVVSLLIVCPVAAGWKALLDLLGVDAPPQDLITLFTKSGDAASLSVMILLAVIVAPVTEEWIFRVGLFRWLRTRAPRGVALFIPAVFFAMIHGNVAVLLPLAALAVVLALGYEHYGHPAVPMLAHALFNLNTVALLLAGFPA
ncbi:MAG: hypothetical protein RLZZ50_1113, partial [Verrucomicrobiota bacterium]